jgi:hypothetical protein
LDERIRKKEQRYLRISELALDAIEQMKPGLT